MRRETQTKSLEKGNISKDKKLLICNWCKSHNTVKNGFRKTGNRGKIQRYICKDCGKSFCRDDGFYRMRNSESKITMAIDMYLSNLSSRKMRNQLQRHFNHKISHVSILDWVRKYVLKVQKFIDGLKPQLSGHFYADETEIQRSRKEKRNDVFWCNVDWGTRYINATYYSPKNQSVEEAKIFLKKAVRHGKPKYIQTDAGVFYPKAMRNLFSSNSECKFVRGIPSRTVEHKVNNVSKTGKHNVRIETVFSKIKDRVYDFRGLKALWSALVPRDLPLRGCQ